MLIYTPSFIKQIVYKGGFNSSNKVEATTENLE
jgi:hypothetical protein